MLKSLLRERRETPTMKDYTTWVRSQMSFGGTANSGVFISPDTAMYSTAVFSCVDILARVLSTLPLKVHENLNNGNKRPAVDYPLYYTLHNEPNPEMSSTNFRTALAYGLGLRGNGLAEMELDNAGAVRYLWPLRPDKYTLTRREDGTLWYVVQLPVGDYVGLPAYRVMHIRGLTPNGLNGVSPITHAREAIGLSLAAEQYGATFFSNGAQPEGIVVGPKEKKAMSDTAYNRFKESWEARHQGLNNSHRVAILEEGFDYKNIGISNDDAQFLETRRFQLQEIARIYHIPPHKLAELSQATFSNIEQQSLEFVQDFVLPWVVNIEQEMQRSLFVAAEKRRYFVKFSIDGLLRGDILSRYQALNIAWQNGVINADEWREMEDMNAQPDGIGKTYYVPLNMAPAQPGSPVPAAGQRYLDIRPAAVRALPGVSVETRELRGKQSARERRRLMNAQKRVFHDVAERVLRREKQDILAAAKKHFSQRDATSFDTWLELFYQQHKTFIERQFSPSMQAYAQMVAGVAADEIGQDSYDQAQIEQFMREYVAYYAGRHTTMDLTDIRAKVAAALAAGQDPLQVLEDGLDEWMDTRAGEIARREAVRENNAVARSVYILGGMPSLYWRATGESCPYCKGLDGKSVGIQQVFLASGQDYQPEGADSPLNPESNIHHPPAHDGCDCMITAG